MSERFQDKAKPVVEQLARDEFREQLYRSFKDKGVVRSLRSQLRSHLASELLSEKKASSSRSGGHSSAQKDLSRRAADALISEHLKCSGYDYTLSVFLAECGRAEGQLLSTRDVLRLLNAQQRSRLQPLLETSHEDHHGDQGLLWQCLEVLINSLVGDCVDVAVQTQPTGRQRLDDRLASLDESFSRQQLSVQRETISSMEERMVAFQKQCQQQSQLEIKRQMEQFRLTEVAHIQMAERKRYEEQLCAMRQELQQQQAGKIEAFHAQNECLRKELNQRRVELESEAYRQRQNHLHEMEMLRCKEADLRRQADSSQRNMQVERDKLQLAVERASRIEKAAEQDRENMQRRIQQEVFICQKELLSKLEDKAKQLETAEAQAEGQRRLVEDRKEAVKRLEKDLEDAQQQSSHLQEKVHCVLDERNAATQQRDHLQNMLEEVKDYQALREQVALLQQALETANRRAEEVRLERAKKEEDNHALVNDLTAKLAQQSPELTLLQQELRHAQQEEKRQQTVAAHTQQLLHQQVEDEIQCNHSLSELLEKQLVVEKQLRQEIMDLQSLLEQSQTALSSHGLSSITHHHHIRSLRHFADDVYHKKDAPLTGRTWQSSKAWAWPRSSHCSLTSEDARTGLQGDARESPQRANFVRHTADAESDDDDAELTVHVAKEGEQGMEHGGHLDVVGLGTTDFLVQRDVFERLEREAEELERSYQEIQARLMQPVPPAHLLTNMQLPFALSGQTIPASPAVHLQQHLSLTTHTDCLSSFASLPHTSTSSFAACANLPEGISSRSAAHHPDFLAQHLASLSGISSQSAVSLSSALTQSTQSTVPHVHYSAEYRSFSPPLQVPSTKMFYSTASTRSPISSVKLHSVQADKDSSPASAAHLPSHSLQTKVAMLQNYPNTAGYHQPSLDIKVYSPSSVSSLSGKSSAWNQPLTTTSVQAPLLTQPVTTSSSGDAISSARSSIDVVSSMRPSINAVLSAGPSIDRTAAQLQIGVTHHPVQLSLAVHGQVPDHSHSEVSCETDAHTSGPFPSTGGASAILHEIDKETSASEARPKACSVRSPVSTMSAVSDFDELQTSESLSKSLHVESLAAEGSNVAEKHEAGTHPIHQVTVASVASSFVGTPVKLDAAWKSRSQQVANELTVGECHSSLPALQQGEAVESRISSDLTVTVASSHHSQKDIGHDLKTMEDLKMEDKHRVSDVEGNEGPDKGHLEVTEQDASSQKATFENQSESNLSLQSAWEMQRRKQEEHRRHREEEARLAWEREQQALAELEHEESGQVVDEQKSESQSVSSHSTAGSVSKAEEQLVEEKSSDGIDPAMLAYMKLVQEQRQEQTKSPTRQKPVRASSPVNQTGDANATKDLDWGLPSDSQADDLGSFGGGSADGSFDWG